MEKTLGKDLDSKMRETYLKDNCDGVEEKGYMKQFTPDELQGHKENLASVSISIMEINAERKEKDAYYRGQLKPLMENMTQLVSDIKAKARYVKELCYKFTDQEKKVTGYYNADGDLIECRPATGEEMQVTIFSQIRKNGTENK